MVQVHYELSLVALVATNSISFIPKRNKNEKNIFESFSTVCVCINMCVCLVATVEAVTFDSEITFVLFPSVPFSDLCFFYNYINRVIEGKRTVSGTGRGDLRWN